MYDVCMYVCKIYSQCLLNMKIDRTAVEILYSRFWIKRCTIKLVSIKLVSIKLNLSASRIHNGRAKTVVFFPNRYFNTGLLWAQCRKLCYERRSKFSQDNP